MMESRDSPSENNSQHTLGRWPFRRFPLPDETLSSWLSRIAAANGVSLHCLCRETWPGRDLLLRDLDRNPPGDVIGDLAEITNVPTERVWDMTLAGLVGSLYECLPERKGHAKWALPYGIRMAAAHGSQFCPDCLAGDQAPHFRRSWKLAFVTVCQVHSRILRDNCPHCHRAPVPTRGPRSLASDTKPRPIHLCRFCQGDLRVDLEREQYQVKWPITPEFQSTLLQALNVNWIDLEGEGVIHSILLFNGIHQWLALLLQRGRNKGFREELVRQLGPNAPEFGTAVGTGKRSVAFEILDVHERHKLMVLVGWLMAGWPDRVLEVCRGARLRLSSMIERSRGDPPYWIHRVVSEQLKVVRTRWPSKGNPHGMGLTYEGLGKRVLEPRLERQDARLRFIRSRTDLWQFPEKLAKAMKCARLYPCNYPRPAILRNCHRLLEVAREGSDVVAITGGLGLQVVKGRRWLVHNRQPA